MHNSTPLISVIIPSYNHVKYLEQRFESILNQTCRDYEIIILDDNSTDNSREVIEHYRDNPKVSSVVYNDTNSGSPFKQWWKGIQIAKGNYVWIAESDDFCEPDFLERIVSRISKSDNCVLAYCDSLDIDEDGNVLSSVFEGRKDECVSGKSFIKKTLLLGNAVYNASSAVFKRQSALAVADDWMKSRGAGDYLFWVYIAMTGEVCIIHKQMNFRRIHNNNLTNKSDSSGSNLTDERKIVDKIYNEYHIPVWRKILAENIRRRRISKEQFDEDDIRNKLFSMWNYGSKMNLLSELMTKAYYTIMKKVK